MPTWPKFVNIRSNNRRNARTGVDTNEYDAEENIFAEYILAVFRPWPAPGYVYQSSIDETHVADLNRYLQQLRLGNFGVNIATGSYHAPPGYRKIILADTVEFIAIQVAQRSVARFIGSLARGLRRDNASSKRCQIMWRARSA